jgi:molybdopterin molybdotransferase
MRWRAAGEEILGSLQEMLTIDEARARIIAAFAPLPSETVPLEKAHGRVLAEDVRARLDQPPAPVSAMDGYAVRAADNGERRVIGASPAGHPFAGSLGSDEAVRIFTGGVVPDGADTIVIQEDAKVQGDRVTFTTTTQPGRSIRPQGRDFHKGDVLGRAGHRLAARDLALLAAGDIADLQVRRKPIVAFAATGDELSRPGQMHPPGGIVASSGYGLSAMIECWGGQPRDLGILADTSEAVASIPALAGDADLILTIGGASVGDHDMIGRIPGLALDFWKVAMRPGKPLIFGKLGSTPLLGLPGNPVSTFVTALLFVRPAIAAMLGAETAVPLRRARLTASLGANDSRQDYMRGHTVWSDGDCWVEPHPVQDSAMLKVLADSDVLIVRAPHAAAAEIGATVDVLPWE